MKVAKTIKLFINGEFPRTESGRSFQCLKQNSKEVYAELCLASRKDVRASVEAAKAAFGGWSKRTAFNRSQILYRAAEMLEGKRGDFTNLLTETLPIDAIQADLEITNAIDSLVYYAGFADKYQQVLGSLNPVASPHHNFTTVEGVGVTALVSSDELNLGKFFSDIASVIVSGNTLVVLLPRNYSQILSLVGEVFHTSDMPGGVVNLLSGDLKELGETFATHMDIRSMSVQTSDSFFLKLAFEKGADDLKRITPPISLTESQSLKTLAQFVEYKTVWHPSGF